MICSNDHIRMVCFSSTVALSVLDSVSVMPVLLAIIVPTSRYEIME